MNKNLMILLIAINSLTTVNVFANEELNIEAPSGHDYYCSCKVTGQSKEIYIDGLLKGEKCPSQGTKIYLDGDLHGVQARVINCSGPFQNL